MVTKEKTLKAQIEEWKKEYGKVYQCTVNDKDYIYRRIKRNEYSQVMSLTTGDSMDERIYARQDAIVRITVLNIPAEELEKDIEDLAGLSSTISDDVLDRSGFAMTKSVEL